MQKLLKTPPTPLISRTISTRGCDNWKYKAKIAEEEKCKNSSSFDPILFISHQFANLKSQPHNFFSKQTNWRWIKVWTTLKIYLTLRITKMMQKFKGTDGIRLCLAVQLLYMQIGCKIEDFVVCCWELKSFFDIHTIIIWSSSRHNLVCNRYDSHNLLYTETTNCWYYVVCTRTRVLDKINKFVKFISTSSTSFQPTAIIIQKIYFRATSIPVRDKNQKMQCSPQ